MKPVFHEQTALARLGGNKPLLLKISAYFVEYSADQLRQLEDAYIAEDFESLKRTVHKSLGTIANFGLSDAYHAGCKLQEALNAANYEEADQLYHNFFSLYSRLRTELSTYSDGVQIPDLSSSS